MQLEAVYLEALLYQKYVYYGKRHAQIWFNFSETNFNQELSKIIMNSSYNNKSENASIAQIWFNSLETNLIKNYQE